MARNSSSSAKQIPRVTPSELIRESILTPNRFVVVEGESDVGVYRFWLERQAKIDDRIDDRSVKFISAKRIGDVSAEATDSGLLPLRGCRGTVITTARIAWNEGSEAVCGIVDLDYGLDEDLPNLLHTDYPALESYAFEAEVLDQLNRRYLKNRLPDGEAIVSSMAPVLTSLFELKKINPKMPYGECRIKEGFSNADGVVNRDGLERLRNFSIGRTVDSGRWAIPDTSEVVIPSEPRSSAYGHDIAKVFVHAFSSELQGVQFTSWKQIESLLMDRLRDWDGIEQEPLYLRLRDFAIGGNKRLAELTK